MFANSPDAPDFSEKQQVRAAKASKSVERMKKLGLQTKTLPKKTKSTEKQATKTSKKKEKSKEITNEKDHKIENSGKFARNFKRPSNNKFKSKSRFNRRG